MQPLASISLKESNKENSIQQNELNFSFDGLVKSFHQVEPAEKEMFNIMIEQEFESFFQTVRGLKDKTLNGANIKIEKNESLYLWGALLPFVYWIFNPNEDVFFLALSSVPFIFLGMSFIFMLQRAKRGVLARLGIKKNDLSLKSKYKMVFLLKMFAYSKYNKDNNPEFMLNNLINMFAENVFPSEYFNELLESSLKERDKYIEKQKRKEQEIKKQNDIESEFQILSGQEKNLEIEAKLEVLKAFTENMERFKNK